MGEQYHLLLQAPSFIMIHFIKTLRYQRHTQGADGFSYVCALLRQEIDPPSAAQASLLLSTPTVFYSPLRRVRDTIVPETRARYQILDALREIPFDLRTFCSHEDWSQRGSAAVRESFINAFVRDDLLETRRQIFSDARDLLKQIVAASIRGDVTVVSHSFRLKVIEALLRTRGDIEREPALIRHHILPQERTYQFGARFSVSAGEIHEATTRQP